MFLDLETSCARQGYGVVFEYNKLLFIDMCFGW